MIYFNKISLNFKYFLSQDSGIVILGGIGESTDFAEDSEQEDADHNR
jgi:hypothetical protein